MRGSSIRLRKNCAKAEPPSHSAVHDVSALMFIPLPGGAHAPDQAEAPNGRVLTGVVLGVAFFLAVSSLMRGSEKDFIKRLATTVRHTHSLGRNIVSPCPAGRAAFGRTVRCGSADRQSRSERPRHTGTVKSLQWIESLPGLRAAPVLMGSAVLTFAGRNKASPSRHGAGQDENGVDLTRENGRGLHGRTGGLIRTGSSIGQGLAQKVQSQAGPQRQRGWPPNGSNRAMKVVGIFRTGNALMTRTRLHPTQARPGHVRPP